jgi:hypothetical protein
MDSPTGGTVTVTFTWFIHEGCKDLCQTGDEQAVIPFTVVDYSVILKFGENYERSTYAEL